MKKLVILFASAIIMLSCEQSSIEVAPKPQMESFYEESLELKSVTPDSVGRFVAKVNSYTRTNPAAKQDPLYPEIVENVGSYLDNLVFFTVSVAGWEEMKLMH